METSTLRKRMPVSALADPKIIVPAIGSAFAKLDPRALDQEPGDVRGRDRCRADHRHLPARPLHGRRQPRLHLPDRAVAVDHRAVRQLLGGRGRGPRQGAGRLAAAHAHRDAGQAAERGKLQGLQARPGHQPEGRRRRAGRGRRHDPLGRRGDRGHRLGQRGGHHRRVGARHPRVRRRPLGGHRRHAGALRLDPRAHHGGARARPSSTA